MLAQKGPECCPASLCCQVQGGGAWGLPRAPSHLFMLAEPWEAAHGGLSQLGWEEGSAQGTHSPPCTCHAHPVGLVRAAHFLLECHHTPRPGGYWRFRLGNLKDQDLVCLLCHLPIQRFLEFSPGCAVLAAMVNLETLSERAMTPIHPRGCSPLPGSLQLHKGALCVACLGWAPWLWGPMSLIYIPGAAT